jgi:hypothetical protein
MEGELHPPAYKQSAQEEMPPTSGTDSFSGFGSSFPTSASGNGQPQAKQYMQFGPVDGQGGQAALPPLQSQMSQPGGSQGTQLSGFGAGPAFFGSLGSFSQMGTQAFSDGAFSQHFSEKLSLGAPHDFGAFSQDSFIDNQEFKMTGDAFLSQDYQFSDQFQ